MKGRTRRGILTAAAVLAVLAGFLLWVCWDGAVYPLKNHLARQEWQRIVDTVPETAAVTFTDGTPGGDVPLSDLLQEAIYDRALPSSPYQSPGTPDWQIFWTDEEGNQKQIQGFLEGKGVYVPVKRAFFASTPELCEAVQEIWEQGQKTAAGEE